MAALGRLADGGVLNAPQPDPPPAGVPDLPRPFAAGMDPSRRIVWVDSMMASVHLVNRYGALVPPGTIRVWGLRGHITRRDTKTEPYRYDLGEIEEYARARGLLSPENRVGGSG